MAFATGAMQGLRFVKEVTWGTTPGTPTMVSLRNTGCTLNLTKSAFQSQELRTDRQISDVRLGANQVGGDINFEFSYAEYDPFLDATMFVAASSAAYNLTSQTMSVVQSTKTYSRSSGSWITDGLMVGDSITVAGFTNGANNGTKTIATVSALSFTVTEALGSDESGKTGTSVTTTAKVWKPGVTPVSFSVERAFTDVAQYGVYTGIMVKSMSLSIKPNAIITGKFSLVGKGCTFSGSELAVPTASQTNAPLDSFSGALTESGSAIAVITGIDLNLENNINPAFVVGSPNASALVPGRCNVTGTASVYFQDSTMLNKFINETYSSMAITLGNGTTGTYILTLPKIKYTGSSLDVSGDGPITMSMPFQAVLDPTTNTNLIIRKSST